MKQALLWTPKGEKKEGVSVLIVPRIPYPFKNRPDRLWTLFHERDENKKPKLPFKPQHLTNAFLEDYVHDYIISGKQLKYSSRVSDGGMWLLLEWE